MRLNQELDDTRTFWNSRLAARGIKVLDEFMENVAGTVDKAMEIARTAPHTSLLRDIDVSPITSERAAVLFKAVQHASSVRLDAAGSDRKKHSATWMWLESMAIAAQNAGVFEAMQLQKIRDHYDAEKRKWNTHIAPLLASLAAMSAAWRRYKPGDSKKQTCSTLIASDSVKTFLPDALNKILALAVAGKQPFHSDAVGADAQKASASTPRDEVTSSLDVLPLQLEAAP
jgi:hypothetical protein